MGNGKSYSINDESMYNYFEKLMYSTEKGGRLPAAWKVGNVEMEYGLTEQNAAMLLGSRRLLYGREDAKEQLCLLETLEKFLHEYIGIEGLEELFINNYGAIENGIFMEHDSEGNSKNIREHAKHQMKNAYLGSVFLRECGYMRNMAENIYRGQSAVTQYLKSAAAANIRKTGKSMEESAILKKLEELSYKIVMVSSLLHDIGYPLAYYLRCARQMTDYPPYLKILCPAVKVQFPELKAYLLDSKLFQLVSQEEIAQKYEKNDHGVLSALSLLMHFYHNGRVYSLNGVERCIIEMSAIAIYRHTDRFCEKERMVYLTDPISYMVRLCDDMQEWERFKVTINEKHNYLQCGNCGRRIGEKNGFYTCDCGQNYRKITMIANKKLNYICLCDELKVEKKKDLTRVSADFNLMKQIEILLEDYTAAVRSAKSLDQVKKMLKDQSIEPKMEFSYYLSNNPIKLIEKMIEKSGKKDSAIEAWIESAEENRKEPLKTFWADFMEKRKDNPYGAEIEKNRLRYKDKVKDYVKGYYGEIYSLYEMLSK